MRASVKHTREHEALAMGVSPRGAQALFRASQALAAVDGRDYVTPDDVKRMVVPVFAHRVLLSTRAAAGQRWAGAAEKILEEILTLGGLPLCGETNNEGSYYRPAHGRPEQFRHVPHRLAPR